MASFIARPPSLVAFGWRFQSLPLSNIEGVRDPQPVPPGTLFPKDREVRSLDGTPIRYASRGRGELVLGWLAERFPPRPPTPVSPPVTSR
jgi:hypothetical protein